MKKEKRSISVAEQHALRSRAWAWFLAFGLTVCALAPIEAWPDNTSQVAPRAAGQLAPLAAPSQTPRSATATRDPYELRDRTDQVKTYRESNEKLGVYGSYLKEDLKTLKDAYDNRSNDVKLWEIARDNAIGTFCFNGEDKDACYQRWALVQNESLNAVHSQVVQNHLSIGELEGQNLPKSIQGGENDPQAFAIETKLPPSAPPPPHKTTPMTAEQMQELATKESVRLRQITSPEYESWVRNLPHRPAKEDFVKLRKRTPAEMADGGEEFVLDHRCSDPQDGVCYDISAFQAAQQDFVLKEQSWLAEQRTLSTHESETIKKSRDSIEQGSRQPEGLRSISSYRTASENIQKSADAAAKVSPGKDVYTSIEAKDLEVAPSAVDPASIRVP